MKNFRMYMSSLAIIALLFTSCSKEESGIIENDSEKATLSFGAIVNDIFANRAATKQAIGDMPACSDDDPAYIRIVLNRGNTEVVGTTANPYRVNLAPGQIFTVEDPALELEQGNYTLTHFSVYNAAGQLIWLSPRGGDLANFVDTPLPLAIDLRAGVKKYVDVPVLCFDNRDVLQYGYQFFEIETNRAVDFCFFANFCDASGMHYSARYRVDVWQGTNENGTVLYSNLTSQTGVNGDGDFFASPVCVALPANDDDRNEDYIYYRLTLLDWEDNYGDVPSSVITGTLSLADIEANYGEGDDVDYEHFRFGCGDDGETPSDRDNDGVPDATDNCPDTVGPESNSGCPEDGDEDGDGVPDSIDECDNTPEGTDVDEVGCPVVTDGDEDGDGVPDSIDECDNTPEGTDVDAVGCPVVTDGDEDGDGVPDSIDECDNTPEGTDVDAVGCPVVTDGDEDGDGVPDSIDECDNTPEGTDVDAVGCPEDNTGEGCQGLPAVCDVDFGTLPADCYVTVLEGADTNGYVRVDSAADLNIDIIQTILGEDWGDVSITVSNSGSLIVSLDGGLPSDRITAYEVEVVLSENGTMSSTCRESQCDPSVEDVAGDQPAIELTFDALQYSYPFYIKVNAVICETIVGE